MAVKKNRGTAPRTAPHAPSVPAPADDTGNPPDGPHAAVQAALAANPGATAAVIAAAAGVHRTAAGRALASLESAGLATRVRTGKPGSAGTWQPAVPAPGTPAEDAAQDSDPAAAAPETTTSEAGEPDEPGMGNEPAVTGEATGTGADQADAESTEGAEPPADDHAEPAASDDAEPAADDDAEPAADDAGHGAGDVAAGDATVPQPADDDGAGEAEQALAAQASEAAEKAHEATAGILAALASGDIAAALTAADGARTAVAEARRAVKAATAGRAAPSARPGQLRDLVDGHLRDHPGEDFGPHQIGKALSRSSGAVANALDRLTELGDAEMTSEQPRRYRSTHAAADAAGGTAAADDGEPLAGAA